MLLRVAVVSSVLALALASPLPPTKRPQPRFVDSSQFKAELLADVNAHKTDCPTLKIIGDDFSAIIHHIFRDVRKSAPEGGPEHEKNKAMWNAYLDANDHLIDSALAIDCDLFKHVV